jgi:hypothetical protein
VRSAWTLVAIKWWTFSKSETVGGEGGDRRKALSASGKAQLGRLLD